ncbi:hypothetical protein EWM64_g1726 [Hericium alpestre]|uniref:Fe2OG dioxygenase domain-containing protein n=1 Tax=Hericium alpestre TaxID=135208 RepID=A0A4Z0A7G7_9AGAM|nr:hypothetical protein EWM64_g1726 [Hericium alpestre]
MLHEAQSWQRNKWWLFDRLVESPHRTSFYVRNISDVSKDGNWNQVSRFWYNGRETEPPAGFPAPMEKACEIIEEVVNAEMHKRNRFPLEWGGVPSPSGGKDIIWRANFAASNCYEGAKETVGFHSDRLTNIGPYATIASLSLGTSRAFRLREVIPVDEVDKRAARTYNIPLAHNSVRRCSSLHTMLPDPHLRQLVIMHASTQERFKHSIPPQSTLDRFHPAFPPPSSFPSLTLDPSNCRINITFRFYRPDFHPDKVPKCKCGLPTTLRPDMKKRQRERGTGKGPEQEQSEGEFRYWWTCTAGDQKEGKGCNFWKVMDVKAEGRGPFAKDTT